MAKSGYTKFGVGLDESEKRNHIIAAAQKVFGNISYQKATVQDIISEAGISRRTFYAYFKNKEDVISELVDNFIDDITRTRNLEILYELKTIEELRDQIIRLAWALFAIIYEHRDIIKLYFEGLVINDQVLSPRSENILDTLNTLIKEYIETAQKKNFIYNEIDSEIMSAMLLGMYMEIVRKFLVNSDPPPIDKLIDQLMALFDRGVFKD